MVSKIIFSRICFRTKSVVTTPSIKKKASASPETVTPHHHLHQRYGHYLHSRAAISAAVPVNVEASIVMVEVATASKGVPTAANVPASSVSPVTVKASACSR